MGCTNSSSANEDASLDGESYHGSADLSAEKHEYNFVVKPSSVPGINKFELQWGPHKVAYQGAMEKLANGELGDLLSRTILKEANSRGWQAVFWECLPVEKSSIGVAPFEFVILEAPNLANAIPDTESFKEHFASDDSKGKSVVAFSNIGNDAYLIVPTPGLGGATAPNFSHLLAFLKEAASEQQRELWVSVGKNVQKRVKSTGKMQWVSTSGMGVSWLHVRIDSTPKYYNYDEYKFLKPSPTQAAPDQM